MSFMGGVSQKNILEVEANKRINQMFFSLTYSDEEENHSLREVVGKSFNDQVC